MFRGFEPASAAPSQGRVVITVGGRSPAVRHDVAAALRDKLGYETFRIQGVGHFAAYDDPGLFAAAVREIVTPG
jgi:pimeloyl-ACP methyl ester carboxylesterase